MSTRMQPKTGALRPVRRSWLLTVSRAALAGAWAAGFSGCHPFTEVALISVRNENAAPLHVRARLRGADGYEDAVDVAPSEERALVKYEEGRFRVEPVEQRVLGLEVVTSAGCVVRLEKAALVRASSRSPDSRRWTIHVWPATLGSARCPTPRDREPSSSTANDPASQPPR